VNSFLPIRVVHRSDGSGTTAVFTQHLSAISPEWKSKVGAAKTVDWPLGIGAKGNEGVTAQIKQTREAVLAMWSMAMPRRTCLWLLWKINLVITLPRRQSQLLEP